MRGRALAEVRPEFVPDVRDESGCQPACDTHGRLLRRRRAWREPGVLNRVAHHVPGEAAPGGCEMPVTPWRQRDGRHFVPDARPGARSARSNVAGILAPDSTPTPRDR